MTQNKKTYYFLKCNFAVTLVMKAIGMRNFQYERKIANENVCFL